MKKLPIIFLITFAALQFVLLIRHKSPYLSDSYFYKHSFYQIKGDNYDQARQKILSQVDLSKEDEIGRNIFLNDQVYQKAYNLFKKRSLYPLLATSLNLFTSEYNSLLIPVFVSYIGVIYFSYLIFKQNLSNFFAVFATGLVLAFYPLLDWATYFLTDVIGLFFWIFSIFVSLNYLKTQNSKYLLLLIATFTISLLNREQNILIFPLFLLVFLHQRFIAKRIEYSGPLSRVTFYLFLTCIVYIIIILVNRQPTFWDTLKYNETSHGLTGRQFTNLETLKYLIAQVLSVHKVLAFDIIKHHWWFTFLALSILGAFSKVRNQALNIHDLIMLASALVSYSFIFIFPIASYRYYFPLTISIIYFSVKFLEDYFLKTIKR